MNSGKKIFWGLYCILAATSLILYKVGVFDSFLYNGVSVWSIIWSIILVAFLIKGIMNRNFFMIFMSVAIILIVFDEPLGITALTPWYVLLAAVLLSIGFSMIFHKKKHPWEKVYHKNSNVIIDGPCGETTENLEGEKVYLKTSMGSSIKYVKSDNFQYAEIKNDFGSMKVYFDNVIVQPGVTPVINVSSSFGEVQLFVPKEWNIFNKGNASFGNISERNKEICTAQINVEVRGNVSFGNMVVNYI